MAKDKFHVSYGGAALNSSLSQVLDHNYLAIVISVAIGGSPLHAL